MNVPRQSRKTVRNVREILGQDYNPILKLRVLSLNQNVSSWIQDATRLAQIYARMEYNHAVCPRLVRLMMDWAQLLMLYAPHYGIEKNKGWVIGAPASQRSGWLRNMVTEIWQWEHCIDMPVSFKIQERVPKRYADSDVMCCILQTKGHDNYAMYKTILPNGGVALSGWVGAQTFVQLERLIKNGLRRHRSKQFQDLLVVNITQARERARTKLLQ